MLSHARRDPRLTEQPFVAGREEVFDMKKKLKIRSLRHLTVSLLSAAGFDFRVPFTLGSCAGP